MPRAWNSCVKTVPANWMSTGTTHCNHRLSHALIAALKMTMSGSKPEVRVAAEPSAETWTKTNTIN